MEPTQLFSSRRSPFSGPGAFVKRLSMFLISSTLVLVLAGSALAQIGAPRPIVAQPISAGESAAELPDVVVAIERSTVGEVERLLPVLRRLPGIHSATLAPRGDLVPSRRFAGGTSSPSPTPPRRNVTESVTAAVHQVLPGARSSIGGREQSPTGPHSTA
ncbi:MAG: hypothetical protein R2706_02575 [Acidimicrobiales bacterium]